MPSSSYVILCFACISAILLRQFYPQLQPATKKVILVYSKKYDNPKYKSGERLETDIGSCKVLEGGSDLIETANAVVIEDLFYIPERASDDQAAWFVSNCDASNRRFEFVKELEKYMKIDIFGKCGSTSPCPKEQGESCVRDLSLTYMFYLAFENSNCKEYITEKLFDMGLRYDWIPLVMGASATDYEMVAPPQSYIYLNVTDKPSEVSEKLEKIFSNKNKATQFFEWKTQGEIQKHSYLELLCSKLSNDIRRRHYEDINEWWHGKMTCQNQGRARICTATGVCEVVEPKYQYIPE